MDLVEAKTKTEKWMSRFGLLDRGWKFEIENYKTVKGRCYYDRKVIALSTWYVSNANGFHEVFSTVLHEITHALVGKRHECKNDHDVVFLRKLEEVVKDAYGL